MVVNFQKIEKRWQDKWEKAKAFEVNEKSKKKKYYVLEMFPYPSGSGLHVGHAFNFTISDIQARFWRMNEFNVLYPQGYDSLGLPAENAAVKTGENPKIYTEKTIKYFSEQQKSLGFSYDQSRLIRTHDPSYFRWDQWIFLKMFEKGLAYKKQSPVNFCPKCNTVLANEQVINGKCWIHKDTNVEIKHLNQWYLKITDYADQLNDFSELKEWPDLIKKLQKNWIGKSHGTEIEFFINGEKWPIFTTRPDTIYGVTFMVVSAQHPRLFDLVTKDKRKDVEKFLKKVNSVSQEDIEQLEKEGVFTGSYAINPVNNKKVPVYAGNFVVADYGCGMVMAVPAHDQRDYEFAKKYNIEIKQVIQGGNLEKSAYTDEGLLINSGEFNGIRSNQAKEKITEDLIRKNIGKKVINFRLRDWLVSRQRYWGTPIPIINCENCGAVPVPEKDLPVELPDNVKFGKGNPLETDERWINIKCPKCGGKGRRETDTMDTFVNSSWYYLRYSDTNNNQEIFDKKKVDYWCPVDFYIGGKEHACMHLIYVRFYTKFLRDLGLLKFNEPAVKLFNQGYVYGEDGQKMSKSIGNVIDPMKTINKYGADSLRLFLVSVASPESDFNWSDRGVEASFKFVNKIYEYFSKKPGKSSKLTESKLNKTIKEINEDIKNLKYNLAVIKLRTLFESFEKEEISKKDAESFLKMLSVICPHISEELWEKLGNKGFISLEKWPVCDESKIDEKLELAEKNFEKLISDVNNILKIIENKGEKSEKIYIYVMPFEIEIYNNKKLSERIEKPVRVFAVNDKQKYDPKAIAGKAKPGKPGIFIE
ncbi:MAG: leucine--tRNA ligase [Candidatus Pacearchaeota archaeon]